MLTTIHRFFLITLCSFLLLLSGCANLNKGLLSDTVKKPEAAIDSIGINDISSDSIGLVLRLSVANPNNYALALAGYDYDVKFNGMRLVEGSTDKGFRIGAGETDKIEIPLQLAYKDVRKIYDSLTDNNKLDYSADVDLRLDAPILNLFKLKTQKKGSLTIPRLPDISFADIKVKRFSFTEIELALEMAVNNTNNFALKIQDLFYDISVGGKQWASGGLENTLTIGKNQVSQISIPFKMRLSELSSSLLSTLKEGSFSDFAVNGNFLLDSDHEALKNIKVPINFQNKP